MDGYAEKSNLFVVDKGKIIAGDKTIRIWDIESGQLLQTLRDHLGIHSFLVRDDKLICNDGSGSMIVYDLRTFTQIFRYSSDTGFSTMLFEHSNLYVGDFYGQLNILEMIGI